MTDPQPLEAVIRSERPGATLSLVLFLMRLHAQHQVGEALVTAFPTEEALQAWLCSPSFLELVDEFAAFVDDVRQSTSAAGTVLSPEQVQQAVASHYPTAVDAVADLAERLQIDPRVLLSVLIDG